MTWTDTHTSFLFLATACLGVALTLNALRPPRTGRATLIAGFFASWLTIELAVHHLVWQLALTVVFVALGALRAWPGWLALALTVTSWGLMLRLWLDARRTSRTMRAALDGLVAPGRWPRVPLEKLWFPFRPLRSGVSVTRDVVFARRGSLALKLDVYAPSTPGVGRPAIVQIHGGAWVIGDKREQGLPLLNHLAANGWVGFNVNYRLSPRATFPDHLVDVKEAVAWVREHAARFGVDPGFIAATGGSAGAHLAAMVALTPGAERFQPGFEDADTSVQAAVLFYGVYDFTDRLGVLPPEFRYGLLRKHVMKRSPDDDRAAFLDASPLEHVGPHAPPTFVIHGDRDTLAPVDYARLLVERLREAGVRVAYAELRGAQHAFDVFASPRTVRTVAAVERFLAAMRDRQLVEPAMDSDPAASDHGRLDYPEQGRHS